MKTSKVFQSESKQGCVDLMNTWIRADKDGPVMSVQLNALGGVTVQTRRHYEPHTPKFCGYTNKGEEVWESVLVIY